MYLFHRHDRDQSGDLDRQEFVVLLEEIGLTLSDEELSELVNAMDSDGDGSVDVGEFAKHIRQAKKDAREVADSAMDFATPSASGNSFAKLRSGSPTSPKSQPSPDHSAYLLRGYGKERKSPPVTEIFERDSLAHPLLARPFHQVRRARYIYLYLSISIYLRLCCRSEPAQTNLVCVVKKLGWRHKPSKHPAQLSRKPHRGGSSMAAF
eukprot:SAG31_NODE_1379_length_8582_cov_17.482848_1_plen_208_part_00